MGWRSAASYWNFAVPPVDVVDRGWLQPVLGQAPAPLDGGQNLARDSAPEVAVVEAADLLEGVTGGGLPVGDGLQGQIGQDEACRLVGGTGPVLPPGRHLLGHAARRAAELAAVAELPPGPLGVTRPVGPGPGGLGFLIGPCQPA